MLFTFKVVSSPLCSFCRAFNETPVHLFSSCSVTQKLWRSLQNTLSRKIIPDTSPQSAIFGFLEVNQKHFTLINHLYLIFKIFIYRSKDRGTLEIQHLLSKIKQVYHIEENNLSESKRQHFLKKWQVIQDIVV